MTKNLTSPPPSKLVLAGENEKALLEREMQVLQSWREQNLSLQSLDLTKTEKSDLQEKLGTQSLFGATRGWHITGWEKLRSPKQLEEMLSLMSATEDAILITINGKITPAKSKLLKAQNWKVEEFPLPAAIFLLLEGIKIKPLPQILAWLQATLEQGSEWGLHVLLSRHARALLAVKEGAPVPGMPPFLIAKLNKQAAALETAELLDILETLYTMESKIKSGKSPLTWSQEFDRLLMRIYYKNQFASRQSTGTKGGL